MLTDQGNCKFGANCALAHYLPDGRRVNRLILDEGESAASALGSLIDLEGREERALGKMQQDEQLSAKYEQFQSEQDVDEELRFQEMEQREKLLAEREARLSQDLHIEREKTARNRKAVTMAPDPVPTWTKADELEQVRQGVHRTINDQGPLSASTLYDNLSVPRWDSMRPALDNEKIIGREPDADRRLLYFTDLDSRGAAALVETASNHQASVLQDAIYKHISGKAFIPRQGHSYRPEESMLADINNKVGRASSLSMGGSSRMSREVVTTITVEWRFYEFLKLQFEGPRPRIGSVLTLTGSVQNAQATTCEAYLQNAWPASGPYFNVLLQKISDMGEEVQSSIRTRRSIGGKLPIHSDVFIAVLSL